MSEDKDLYQRWADGDNAAGALLVDRYLAQIGRFFANKVSSHADTEDLASRTFELCARGIGSFRGDSSFRTYLFGIARNVLRDYVKVRGRKPDVDFEVTAIADIGPTQSVIVAEREEQAILLQAMRSIPLAFQIVLEMSFFEELTQAEIAEMLSIPPGTVANRLRRGKQKLFKRIEELASTQSILESTMSSLADWARSLRRKLDDDSSIGRGDR